MSTEKDHKSEELNESELDNVAGGYTDDGSDRISPEEQEEMERMADEQERARHEGDGSDDGRV